MLGVKRSNPTRGKWLLSELEKRNITAVDISRLLGMSRDKFYEMVSNPLTFRLCDLMLIHSRTGIPLHSLLSYCFGSSGKAINNDYSSTHWYENE